MARTVTSAFIWLATPVREAAGEHCEADKVQFVPAVVDAVVPAPIAAQQRKIVRKADSGLIEIEVDGITIRAGRGADAEDGVIRSSAAELSALLEGLDWRRVHTARETVVPTQAG